MARGKTLIPNRITKRLPPPDRAREKKITARFTDDEFEFLGRLSGEREEKVSSFVRNIVLGVLEQIKSEPEKR